MVLSVLLPEGYDVWFGNVRGNIFSRNHSTLDLLDPLFWDFSWDEMAARDLPAMLTQELLVSGASQLSYIGHSQGTTIGMAFLASHAGSELVKRINVCVLGDVCNDDELFIAVMDDPGICLMVAA